MTDISYGTGLFAVEQGTGAPFVYLHGGLADHRVGLYRLATLPARLILPDVRGAGRSHHADELSWDLLADDVAALLDHLRLARAAIGGVSSGSAIAVRFALRYPERTTKLVIQSPVFAGADRGLVPAQATAMRRMREVGERVATEGIAALLPLYEALPPEIRDRAIEMARSFDPASVAATTRFLDSGAQPFATLADLAALTMPVLVIPGTDPEPPAELAAEYARAIPHAVVGDDIAAFLQS